ncbi:MAG: uracil-DNA glycosylase [Flavobacteriales bacterium]
MLFRNKLEKSWENKMKEEFEKDYFSILNKFLKQEYKKQTIFPEKKLIFNALNSTPFNKVKVVIIGQDPYHGKEQAHGLSFSVTEGIKTPPSLVNIFKEIESDLKINNHGKGDLKKWAKQGVLLLNATLTVRENTAGSHQNKGWEQFTDQIISTISEERKDLVFLLWGKFAQNKAKLIDKNKHHILMSSHPSPLSSYRGFFGCKHFSECNNILKRENKTEINWQL